LDLDEVSTLASRKSTAGNWPYFAILLPIQRKNQSGKVVETQDRPLSSPPVACAIVKVWTIDLEEPSEESGQKQVSRLNAGHFHNDNFTAIPQILKEKCWVGALALPQGRDEK